jgi:dienelactone hydrolase
MQSRVIDATIDLRDDETAARASVFLSMAEEPPAAPPGGHPAGPPPPKPAERSLGEGAIYWSDMIPSSVEQAVLRARQMMQAPAQAPALPAAKPPAPSRAQVTAASLFSDARGEVEVERLDGTDWVVSYHGKRYEVLTGDDGHMLAATLPEFGVTIERRGDFPPEDYPLWPPNAAPPDGAYRARDVSIRAAQGHLLAGTLTTPSGPGPFPAVVLITGLGPSNRNGGDPPWMPLRDLADAFTRAGVAVLRVDDRGVGASTGDHGPSTTFDEADDVATEVAWLRARPGIDARQIALAGYSEGGLIAPMVAAKDPAIAAIVLLAGPGVPMIEVGRYQIEAAVTRDPSIAPADREKEIEKQLADEPTARERTVLTIDPMVYSRRVRTPALVIQGANDLHVPLRSLERLAQAMRAAGDRDVTVRVFPGISHSLLPDASGLSDGWVMLPAFHTSPEILRAASEWLSARLVKPPRSPRSSGR